MLFKAFEWDEANTEHVLRHNVAPDEVEEVCVNKPHVRKTIEFIVGISKGRGVFRTITARDMAGREKSLYKRR